MNKNILVIVSVIIGLLLIGGVAYSMQLNSQSQVASETIEQSLKDNPSESSTPEIQDNLSNFSGNIFDLINQNKNIQCTFEGELDGTRIEGATLVSGDKMRGEFKMDFEGQEISTNLISDGEYLYTWTPSLNTGMKMKIDDASKDVDSDSQVTEEEINDARKDFQQNYDYDCGSWSPDDSVFELPEDVNFTDYSEMINDLKQNSQDLCSSCEMIQDSAGKAQCKEQLGCE